MKPNWSVKNEILKRAQRESEHNWAISNSNSNPNLELPKYEKVKVVENSPGWYNLIMNTLRELKP